MAENCCDLVATCNDTSIKSQGSKTFPIHLGMSSKNWETENRMDSARKKSLVFTSSHLLHGVIQKEGRQHFHILMKQPNVFLASEGYHYKHLCAQNEQISP